MDSFDFVIPLSLDGLQESSSTRQYVVTNITSARELPKKVQECSSAFRQEKCFFVLHNQNFDILYSILVNIHSIDDDICQQAFTLIIKALECMTEELPRLLDARNMDSNDRNNWLNVVKMTTYLASNLTEAMENQDNKPNTDELVTGKGRKKSSKKNDGIEWDDERQRMLMRLHAFVQVPLQQLWDPPIVEEDFVNLVANCCYKILETPTIGQVRSKNTRDLIFQVLGSVIKKFNHGLACSLKLMQLLQHFEHLVSAAAQGVVQLIESFGIKSVLSEMIREISKADARDFAKDQSGLRNYAQFLCEVGEKCPQLMMGSLSLLVGFLDEEAYTMRNCVLSILGCVVAKVLTGEELDTKGRDLRDQCLDHLEDHIHDVNAFVRSRVLQVWQELVTEKAVPLSRQHQVLALVIDRLKDKSSNVRKSAIQLLTAFLKGNPFAAKLSMDELELQHATELQKLQTMIPEVEATPPRAKDSKGRVSPADSDDWLLLLPALTTTLLNVVNEDEIGDESSNDGLSEDAILNDVVTHICQSLQTDNFPVAVKCLRSAFAIFPDADVLQCEEKETTGFLRDSKEDLTEEQSRYLVVLRRIYLCGEEMQKMLQEEVQEDMIVVSEEQKEVKKQKLLVEYLKDSVSFTKLLYSALPIICQLLGSRQSSDVLDAINFFVSAFEFGLSDAMIGVRRMLALVWSKEPGIRDAVVSAYQRLYIRMDAPNDRARAFNIVCNLTALISGATLGERTSMEEIVSALVKTGDINKNVITLLWERFTKTLPDTSDDDARSSLVLLTMTANCELDIISNNINVIITCAFGERGEKDFSLVKESCSALLKLTPEKAKSDSKTAPYRMEANHPIFTNLCRILEDGLSRLQDCHYSPMAVEAVTVIYSLAETPDIICGELIRKLAKQMLTDSDSVSEGNTQPHTEHEVSVRVLSRFLVVIGHVAIRQLVHLDTHILGELKRRNFIREEHEAEKVNQKHKKSQAKKTVSSLMVAETPAKGDGDIDDEMGLTGAVADDTEAEYIRSICDTEIINDDNMLGLLKPLIWSVCTNPSKYHQQELRVSAALALTKFMMISPDICEDNLQLLFTILEKSTEPVIRANTIVGLGDLSFRYPNQVEPWTPKLYERLHDDSTRVRRNTLTVLTHLILNDMVKVKGQISDIALCITDDDARIAGLAKMFFTELGRKGNALYNVLPDIISRLSDVQIGIDEDRFRVIILHIFALIQKDKQLEMLVEKLCHRFQAITLPRQWRDIAFCLSLLQCNEKCVRKLSENFTCYSDKLHEPEVYELFISILANARKLSRPEAKVSIEELEVRLQECHSKGVEDENVAHKASDARGKAKKVKTAAQRSKARRSRLPDSEEDSESEDENEDVRKQLHPMHKNNKDNKANLPSPPKTAKKNNKRPVKKLLISSESDSDRDFSDGNETSRKLLKPLPPSNSVRASARTSRTRRN